MTEVQNFFQSMFSFKSIAPVSANKQEIKLAVLLKSEAKKYAALGDEEMRNGRTTQALVFDSKDKNQSRMFAEIAIWHHRSAAENYCKAAARFEEAGKLQTSKSWAFNAKSKEMRQQSSEAKSAVNKLNDFIKK